MFHSFVLKQALNAVESWIWFLCLLIEIAYLSESSCKVLVLLEGELKFFKVRLENIRYQHI